MDYYTHSKVLKITIFYAELFLFPNVSTFYIHEEPMTQRRRNTNNYTSKFYDCE